MKKLAVYSECSIVGLWVVAFQAIKVIDKDMHEKAGATHKEVFGITTNNGLQLK